MSSLTNKEGHNKNTNIVDIIAAAVKELSKRGLPITSISIADVLTAAKVEVPPDRVIRSALHNLGYVKLEKLDVWIDFAALEKIYSPVVTEPIRKEQLTDLQEYVLLYTSLLFPLIPCKPKTNVPLFPNFEERASTDLRIVQGWIEKEDCNIAMLTGSRSNIVAVQFAEDDEEHEIEGMTMPHTVTIDLGGMATCYLFKYNDRIKTKKISEKIATISDGGYILLPPSICSNGEPCRFVEGYSLFEAEIAEMPQWLISRLTSEGSFVDLRLGGISETYEGEERIQALTSIAAFLRRSGFIAAEIEKLLAAANEERCRPPLSEKQVKEILERVIAIVDSFSMQNVLPERDVLYEAIMLPHFVNKFRWVRELRQWFEFNGKKWMVTSEERVIYLAQRVLQNDLAIQLSYTNDKYMRQHIYKALKGVNSRHNVASAVNFIKGRPEIHSSVTSFDKAPFMLNCNNGVLNLKTLELLPHDPALLITQLSPANYSSSNFELIEGSNWQKHLELCQPNPDVRRYLQRRAGIALSGVVMENALDIWYGTGANGKTTTANLMIKVLGDYGIRAATSILLEHKNEQHPTGFADLQGKRLVIAEEPSHTRVLDEAVVKDLTGGGMIKARKMRGDFFQFEPTFSIILIMNHMPEIKSSDWGIWRRLNLVNWDRIIPYELQRPPKQVIDELYEERDIILAWAIEGLMDYLNEPKWQCKPLEEQNALFRQEVDSVATFLEDQTIKQKGKMVAFATLYEAFGRWMEGKHYPEVSPKWFSTRLKQLGYKKQRYGVNSDILVIDLKLKNETGIEYIDYIPVFMDEFTEPCEGERVSLNELFSLFEQWMVRMADKKMLDISSRAFSMRLTKMGYRRIRVGERQEIFIKDIRLKARGVEGNMSDERTAGQVFKAFRQSD